MQPGGGLVIIDADRLPSLLENFKDVLCDEIVLQKRKSKNPRQVTGPH